MKKAEFKINTKTGEYSVNGYVGKVEFVAPENKYFTLYFGINKNLSRYASDRRWIVTELSTGMALSHGRTQKEAIECSCRGIRGIGVSEFFERVEETVAKKKVFKTELPLNTAVIESIQKLKPESGYAI